MDTTETTLGDLVLRQPLAAGLFERLALDYCCGGQRTLADACAGNGLDAAAVAAMVDALDDEHGGPEHHDVAGASIAELCDHIVAAHHQPLASALPRADDLLATVVRVHGGAHRELHDLRRLFATLRRELEEHMCIEEANLFPACRSLDDPTAASRFDAALLALLEDDHDSTGDALSRMRDLCGGYDTGEAFCATHRALLHALHELEVDLHRHVHEENNVLFPRVRARLAA